MCQNLTKCAFQIVNCNYVLNCIFCRQNMIRIENFITLEQSWQNPSRFLQPAKIQNVKKKLCNFNLNPTYFAVMLNQQFSTLQYLEVQEAIRWLLLLQLPSAGLRRCRCCRYCLAPRRWQCCGISELQGEILLNPLELSFGVHALGHVPRRKLLCNFQYHGLYYLRRRAAETRSKISNYEVSQPSVTIFSKPQKSMKNHAVWKSTKKCSLGLKGKK